MIFPQSIFVYVHVRGFFSPIFSTIFQGPISDSVIFLTVIIVIISLLMGRGDILRNI